MTEFEDTDTEATARKHGWVPKEEYTGDPDNWVDAHRWEERSKRERLQEAEITELKKAVEQSGELLTRLEAREKDIREGAEKAALEKLKAEMKEAVEEGDPDRAEAAVEEFGKQTEQPEPYSSPEDYAARQTWLKNNPLYLRQDVAASATNIYGLIISDNPNLTAKQILERGHEEVMKIYPELFRNENREKPPPVEGDGQRAAPKKGGMDAETRAAMEDYAIRAAKYGPYKGRSGEGFEADKKPAMASFKKSFERDETEDRRY